MPNDDIWGKMMLIPQNLHRMIHCLSLYDSLLQRSGKNMRLLLRLM